MSLGCQQVAHHSTDGSNQITPLGIASLEKEEEDFRECLPPTHCLRALSLDICFHSLDGLSTMYYSLLDIWRHLQGKQIKESDHVADVQKLTKIDSALILNNNKE